MSRHAPPHSLAGVRAVAPVPGPLRRRLRDEALDEARIGGLSLLDWSLERLLDRLDRADDDPDAGGG